MEFHEKLQHLRKQNKLTQEQLAELLYVSRTAVSKWESGKGYPNLESLKALSRLFHVSIDELLSNGEIIDLAQRENRSNLKCVSSIIFAALDILCLAFLFLPIFGQQEGDYFKAVALVNYTDISQGLRVIFLVALVLIFLLGIGETILSVLKNAKLMSIGKGASLVINALAILAFALSRQAYITAYMFVLFLLKILLFIMENRKTL